MVFQRRLIPTETLVYVQKMRQPRVLCQRYADSVDRGDSEESYNKQTDVSFLRCRDAEANRLSQSRNNRDAGRRGIRFAGIPVRTENNTEQEKTL